MRVRTGKVEINRDRAIQKTIGFNGGQRNLLDECIRFYTNKLFRLLEYILETYVKSLDMNEAFCLEHD